MLAENVCSIMDVYGNAGIFYENIKPKASRRQVLYREGSRLLSTRERGGHPDRSRMSRAPKSE